jgi:predicted lipoprotein with Yx(FWY)xxD motif
MRRLLVLGAVSAAIVLVAAGCGKSTSNKSASASPPATSPSTTAAPATTAAAARAGATVVVKGSKLGRVLVDAKGRTLYLFEKDKGTKSTCYGACASGWPPYTTSGTPQAGSGATASLLGTTARTDGTTQVTYNGHPLYYFVGDTKPGALTGEGVNAFGAKWYVLAPNGNKIDKD